MNRRRQARADRGREDDAGLARNVELPRVGQAQVIAIRHRHADFGNGFAEVKLFPQNAFLVFGTEDFGLIGGGQFEVADASGGNLRDGGHESSGDVAAHEFFGDRLRLLHGVFPRSAPARERFVVGPFRHPENREKRKQRDQRDDHDHERPAINCEHMTRPRRWSFRVHSRLPEITQFAPIRNWPCSTVFRRAEN